MKNIVAQLIPQCDIQIDVKELDKIYAWMHENFWLIYFDSQRYQALIEYNPTIFQINHSILGVLYQKHQLKACNPNWCWGLSWQNIV